MLLQKSVLVVEDQAVIAVVLEDELVEAGYRVMGPFATCQAALAALAKETPSTAILNPMFQDSCCQEIAEELNQRGVPFVIYSVQRHRTNTVEAYAKATWIEKPTLFETLLDALVERTAS